MKIGFNLLVLGGLITQGHLEHLRRLAALGYDGVEIPVLDGDAAHYRQLASLCADLGLERTSSSRCSALSIPVVPTHQHAVLPTTACAGRSTVRTLSRLS